MADQTITGIVGGSPKPGQVAVGVDEASAAALIKQAAREGNAFLGHSPDGLDSDRQARAKGLVDGGQVRGPALRTSTGAEFIARRNAPQGEVQRVPATYTSEEVKGFFGRIWDSISGFFAGIFKSEPSEPKPSLGYVRTRTPDEIAAHARYGRQ